MRTTSALLVLAGAVAACDAYAVPQLTRRNMLGLAAAAGVSQMAPPPALAADTVKVYFGAGCFWHVQHEFVGEEVAALKRSPAQITAVSGYAGGQRLGDGGKVCYHNMRNFADYGRLGHAEAVQLEIPTSALPRFCKKYFDLFGTRGYRHDPQDRGGEYRSVLGLPGGMDSPLFEAVRKAAAESPGGMKLYAGRGDEPDTIGDKAVAGLRLAVPLLPGGGLPPVPQRLHGPAVRQELQRSLAGLVLASNQIASTGCPEPPPQMLF